MVGGWILRCDGEESEWGTADANRTKAKKPRALFAAITLWLHSYRYTLACALDSVLDQ